MFSDVAVSVKNVSKCYQIYDRPQDRLKQSLWRGKKQFYREFWALKNISFEVNRGETIGIIGRNGSGKSTLLQIIAGTLKPTTGEVHVNGRIAALLELGSGFNPEFTGRENVYLNGAILGLTREEMDQRIDDIIAFAEIEDFIDQPVKTYSSGMYVRLAFAVASSIDPELLIVDEALAVGDARFQLKCYERIRALKESGTTILFVSHDMQSVRQFCDIAYLFEKGSLIETGSPNSIINTYTKLLSLPDNVEKHQKGENNVSWQKSEETNEYRYGNQMGVIEHVEILNSLGEPTVVINSCDKIKVRMIVRAMKQIENPIYAMTIKTVKGLEVYGTNSYYQDIPFCLLNEGDQVEVTFEQTMNLMPGTYFLSFGFVEKVNEDIIPLDRRYDAIELKVISKIKDRSFGLVNLNSQITINLLQTFNKEG